MTAYWISFIEVTDPDKFAGYAKDAPAAVAKHGGKMVARGGKTVGLEGKAPGRIAVLEFPTLDAAVKCYNSPEYQAAKKKREGAANCTFVVTEGLS
ncbi:MAG TPA: DUF1330 domain-containing protein [Alphaproteobacteria bacterium]